MIQKLGNFNSRSDNAKLVTLSKCSMSLAVSIATFYVAHAQHF